MPQIITMTPEEYHKVRETIASQKEVAKMLGVDIRTVQRRECGEILITFEAVRALYCLCAINILRDLIGKLTDNGIKRKLDGVVVLLEGH